MLQQLATKVGYIMKIKSIVLAAALLAIAVTAELATKQASNPGWEASVMGVYVNTDSARRDADYGLGLRVGLMKELQDKFHMELAGFGNDIERKVGSGQDWQYGLGADAQPILPIDRKSTRLNSSHVSISYAVFCVKKKIGNKLRQSGGPSLV